MRLLEFIAQRPSLHFEVSRVEAYDIRDARSLIALYSVGWYVDLEISNGVLVEPQLEHHTACRRPRAEPP